MASVRGVQAQQVQAECPLLKMQKQTARVPMQHSARFSAEAREGFALTGYQRKGLSDPNLDAQMASLTTGTKAHKVLSGQHSLLSPSFLEESQHNPAASKTARKHGWTASSICEACRAVFGEGGAIERKHVIRCHAYLKFCIHVNSCVNPARASGRGKERVNQTPLG